VADLLVDTDIFVDHLRGARRFRPGDQVIHYSVVTRAELFAGRATEEDRVSQLLAPFREVGVTRAVAERAGWLRRVAGLRLADAVIAATALEHDLALVTRNHRDFRDVVGLVLVPLEMSER
jgi:predicted nucleic acid-binding protein